MAPDPPMYPVDESLSQNYDATIIINSDDSDTEGDEQQAHDGYTLLGQHEQAAGALGNEEESETESDEVISNYEQNAILQEQGDSLPPPPAAAGRIELANLWNETPSSNSITIDDERSAQIREAMAGFSLPPSAVPSWASNIPEELWKERLLGRLQQNLNSNERNMK